MSDPGAGRGPASTAVISQLAPVATTERLDVLDILRGFALFGVLVANVVWFLTGYGELAREEAQRLPTAAFDPLVLELETFFVVDKFISIFCFLFGVGFALQLKRASESGTVVARLYVRRMLWLFLFGAAHAILIYYGDILHLYAVLGLLLIAWVSRSDRTIALWGLGFALLVPIAVKALLLGLPVLTGGAIDPAAAFAARWDAVEALHSAFAHGSYVDVVRANVADVRAWLTTDDALTKGVSSFGKMLLGFWAGRTGILVRASVSPANAERTDADSAVRLIRRGLAWGLAVGVLCQGVLLRDDFPPALHPGSLAADVTRTALWNVGVLGLATFYVCAIVLLFRRPACKRFLHVLAPVGRMALTNYLGQSVIAIAIFYGLGLGWYGRVGPTAAVGVCVGIFAAQALASAWWLRLFQFGPAEWAWRSLTYGRKQPLRSGVTV